MKPLLVVSVEVAGLVRQLSSLATSWRDVEKADCLAGVLVQQMLRKTHSHTVTLIDLFRFTSVQCSH